VVIDENALRYLVHENDETIQIAQVVNRGLDIAAAIQLGVNLDEALALSNGKTKTTKSAATPIPPRETPALPTAAHQPRSQNAPSDHARMQLVQCPRCQLGYRRSSLAQHLEKVHSVRHSDALNIARRAPEATDDVRRSTRGGSSQRALAKSERARLVSPLVLWPRLNIDEIERFVREHPSSTARDVAIALADPDPDSRCVKTAANRLDALLHVHRVRYDIKRGPTGQGVRAFTAVGQSQPPHVFGNVADVAAVASTTSTQSPTAPALDSIPSAGADALDS